MSSNYVKIEDIVEKLSTSLSHNRFTAFNPRENEIVRYEKEMKMIKEYKENFSKAFLKDFGDKLKEIVNSTNQTENKDTINSKIDIIIKLKDEIGEMEKIPNIITIRIESKNTEINNFKTEIESNNSEIKKINKRFEKTKIIESDLLGKLKLEFKKIDVDLVE